MSTSKSNTKKAASHGTYYFYVKKACRCAECTEASAAYKRQLLERDRELLAQGNPPFAHGTKRAYNAGCREDCCKDIGSSAARRHRAKKAKEQGKEYRPHKEKHAAKGVVKHGTASGYVNGGCREECCKAAYREERKKWRTKPRIRKKYPDKRVGERRRVKPPPAPPPPPPPPPPKPSSPEPRITAATRRAAYLKEHARRLANLLDEA